MQARITKFPPLAATKTLFLGQHFMALGVPIEQRHQEYSPKSDYFSVLAGLVISNLSKAHITRNSTCHLDNQLQRAIK